MSKREFQYIGGTSKKFWHIELSGSSHTVQFGRIGTAGQQKTKDFGSDDLARKAYDKLIAEKLKEGYVEVTSGAAPASVASTPSPTTSVVAPPPPAKAKAPKPRPATEAEAPPAPASAEAPPAAPVTHAAAISADVTRTIDLEPEDWRVATWRPRTPPQSLEPAPFDFSQCVARAGKIKLETYGWDWNFDPLGLAETLSREEAHFWFLMMTETHQRTEKPKVIAERLGQQFGQAWGVLTLDAARKRLEACERGLSPWTLRTLANLFSPSEILELVWDPVTPKPTRSGSVWDRIHSPELLAALAIGIGRYAVPRMTDAELDELRKRLRPTVVPANVPSDFYVALPPEFYLAAACGLHQELAAVVAAWPDDHFQKDDWTDHYQQPQRLVCGLGSPQAVESEMRRLRLRLRKPEYVRAFLACTEYAALDYVGQSLLAETNRDEATGLIETLARVKAPEAAPVMLELMLASKAPSVAREWLFTHVAHTVTGLATVAGGRGKLAEAAVQLLRDFKRRGYGELLASATQHLEAEPAERLRREVLDFEEKTYAVFDESSTPPALAAALEATPPLKGKLPNWLAIEELPPLVVGSLRLNPSQVAAVLAALQQGEFETPPALLRELRAQGDVASLDAFAWDLFQRWSREGSPSKEKWAMGSIGFLGGDSAALKITPLIRNWPGESQHQRAVFGLECLRAIGTDTALMQLNGIAQKLKFKGLKTRAMECMEAIATTRGLTRAELEDCIVPDCELDERGSRVFDFGPRQFRFVLGPDMKPLVRDADGKLKTDLPKPTTKDDAEKSAAAVEAWKLLKKQIKEVGKIQATRLEQAMVTGRRWKPQQFAALLVHHPLMTNLVRLVLWGQYDAAGQVTATFRVTEEQDYADQEDEPCELHESQLVGIIHPLQLSVEQKAKWGEVFSDYEIIPPFAQLGRPTFGLEPSEQAATSLQRFGDGKIPAVSLVGTLERLGWMRGIPEDGGVFHEHTKPFYGANVTAVVEYEGVPVGYMEGWEDQPILDAFLIPGVYSPKVYPDHKQRLKLGEVDPVVISEMLSDLTMVASKGK